MHKLGYAHTDIKGDNVFVDLGVAFLDDLEFVALVSDPPREGGLFEDAETAADQDLKQLELFQGNICRL